MEVKTWIVKLFKSIFSAAFSLFKKETMNKNQIKAFVAEKIIYNLIELTNEHDLSKKHLQAINDFIKDEVLDY